jgi:hypothetical protein
MFKKEVAQKGSLPSAYIYDPPPSASRVFMEYGVKIGLAYK